VELSRAWAPVIPRDAVAHEGKQAYVNVLRGTAQQRRASPSAV
jgi:hypothetical protein